MKIICIGIAIMVIMSGCKKNMDNWDINYPSELEYEVKLFKENAPKGLKAGRLSIILTGHGLSDIHGSLCAGLSKPKEHTIYLDTTSSHWAKSKTALVLHELGHYVLDRDHKEKFFVHQSLQNLIIPESVMTTQPEPEDETLDGNSEIVDYYLNELFNGS